MMRYKKKSKSATWTKVPGAKPVKGGIAIKAMLTPAMIKHMKAVAKVPIIYPLSKHGIELAEKLRRFDATKPVRWVKPPRRRPIRHLSPHRRAETVEDGRRLAAWWPLNRYCLLYPDTLASDRHHVFGRANKLLLLVRLWVPLSRNGHAWVEQHRLLARAIGLLCPLGRFGGVPDERTTEEHEYRLAVYRFVRGIDLVPLKPGPLVSAETARQILREVLTAWPAVRKSL